MSNRSKHSGEHNDQPLFQNVDKQEQLFAPEQVPGGVKRVESDDPDTGSIVPPAPTTTITTPELTLAGAASIATNKEAVQAQNKRDEAQ